MSLRTANVRGREDLSSVIDMLNLKDDDMKFLSFIRFLPSIAKAFGKKVTAQKYEWVDDAARSESVTSGTSGTGVLWDSAVATDGLTINSGDIAILRVGDMLLLTSGEVVVVSVINTSANTIDVYVRGHGSTTGAAQGEAAFEIEIIFNAQAEDADPLDPNHTTPSEKFNYTQIIEDVAQITRTLRRSGNPKGDELDYQVVKKLKESLRLLNRGLSEGIRDLDVTNKVGTMGGLREFITNTSDVSGALTKALLYTAVISHINAGLFPSAIHGSPAVIGDIEQLYEVAVRTSVDTIKGGTKIKTIALMGHDVELHVDKHVRSSEALILDYNRIGFGPLEGGTKNDSGEFATFDVWDKVNGKQISKQIVGEFTLRVSNGGGTRMFGIT